MIALKGFSWMIWQRNRPWIIAIAIFITLFSCSKLAFGSNLPIPIAIISSTLLAFSFLGLVAFFLNQETDVATKGSAYPAFLMTLPLRTWQLALIPMAMATSVFFGLGYIIASATYSHSGEGPVIFCGLASAALIAMLQAIFWYPIGIAYSKLVLTLVGISMMVFFIVSAMADRVPEATINRWLLVMIVVCYAITYLGVAQARRGETQLVRLEKRETQTLTNSARWKPPFSSSAVAQRWYEWRQQGLTFPALVLFLFVVFYIPLRWNDTYSPFLSFGQTKDGLVPTIPTYMQTYLPTMIALVPMIAWVIGCGARRSEVKHSDRTFLLFFGTRPMSDGGLVAQKLWTAFKSTVVAWAVVLFCALTLFTQSAGMYDRQHEVMLADKMTLFEAFKPFLTANVLWAAIGLLLLMIAVTWRNYAIGFWTELSGKTYLRYGYPFVLLLLLTAGPGLASTTWGLEIKRAFNVNWAVALMTFLVVVKVIAIIWLIAKQLSTGLMSKQTLLRSVACYGVAMGGLLAIIFALTPDIRRAYVEWGVSTAPVFDAMIVGFVFMWTPIVRILLAPMMLSMNRHRAE